MSLINYVEPFDAGSFFVGIGGLIMTIVLSIIFYRLYIKLVQYIDIIINREIKYEILEEVSLNEVGKKRGINLEEELVRRKITHNLTKKKSFRKRIEDQVYENMFGKDNKENK